MKSSVIRNRRGNSKPIFTKKMKEKIGVLFCVIVLLLLILSIRILLINSSKGDEYTVQVLSQQNYSSTTIPYQRGNILDRNGNILATSVKVFNLILDPKVMTSKDYYVEPTITALCECFGYDADELRTLIEENKEKSYIIYEKKMAYSQIEQFVSMQNDTENNPYIKGVWFETEYERKYPYSNLACQVLGFTAAGNVGTWGIEEYYDEYLDGVDGREYGYVNSDNIMESVTREAQNGYTVVSTIDVNIQTMVEKRIAEWQERYNCENIGVIVMDPNSGEILSMATDISFDLNNPRDLSGFYTEEELNNMTTEEQLAAMNQIWRNFCLSDSYEPGSTFKPFTATAALEEGVITTEDTFICDGGEYYSGYNIKCHYTPGHGEINVVTAIAHSCNDVMMQIGSKLGIATFLKYQDLFNFGRKTGIDLPGEASCQGLLFTLDNMKDINLATCSFGQSFNVTMVQMIAGFCSVINGGYYYQPHVVKEICNEQGGVVKEIANTPVKQVSTEETCAIIREGLIQCIESGTGWFSKLQGYTLGAKTGTAEKLPRGSDEWVLSIIGYAGIDDPQVVVYAVFDHPEKTGSDTTINNSFFKTIMGDILPYLNIFPDEVVESATTEVEDEDADTVDEEENTVEEETEDSTAEYLHEPENLESIIPPGASDGPPGTTDTGDSGGD